MTKNSLWFLNLTLNAHQTRKRGKKTNTACNPKGSADLRQGKTTLPPRRRKSNNKTDEVKEMCLQARKYLLRKRINEGMSANECNK